MKIYFEIFRIWLAKSVYKTGLWLSLKIYDPNKKVRSQNTMQIYRFKRR